MNGIPCDRPYTKPTLNAAFVGSALGLSPREVSQQLHDLKQSAGIGGRSVIICLDNGEVYDPVSCESIGNLLDGL